MGHNLMAPFRPKTLRSLPVFVFIECGAHVKQFHFAGIVSASVGAKRVVLTDLPDNLLLLRTNAEENKTLNIVSVEALVWGSQSGHLEAPFDIIIATDVMYIVEALNPLIQTIKYLSGPKTTVLLAYGRNRQAEEMFVAKIAPHFVMEKVADSDLDDLYQCLDVDVYQLSLTKCTT